MGCAAAGAQFTDRCAALAVLAAVLPGDSALVRVAGVDSLRIDAEQAREFFHYDIEYELGEFLFAVRAGQQRPPVHHDPGRPGGMQRVARLGRARVEPGQRHRLRVVVRQLGRRDFLDGEFHSGQLGLPARLKLGDRLEHQVIEALRPAPVERHVLRDQQAAQPTAVPVPSPDPRRARRLRRAPGLRRARRLAIAAMHNPRG